MSKRVKCPECRHEFETPEPPPAGNSTDVAARGRVDLHGTDDALTQKSQRRRMTGKGIALRLIALTIFLAASTTAIVVIAQRIKNRPQDDSAQQPQRPPANNSKTPAEGTKPVSDSISGELLQLLDQTVVRIEGGGPGGFTEFGAGFVIDESGLIATNYHVVADSTVAQVRFRNKVTYEIEGYAAVSPEDDLAILKMRDPPPNLRALKLQIKNDPQPQSAVLAIGHPHGVAFSTFDGRVSQILDTAKLPRSSQRFLQLQMKFDKQHQWIQHTAGLSEGNSGGPLVNSNGEVVGINTWVDKQSGYGYALHAMYIDRLLSRQLIKAAPLERYASKDARTEAGFHRLSVERVKELFEKVKAVNWCPKNHDDYDAFQQLAWAITIARFPNSLGLGVDETLVNELIEQIDEVEAHLNQHKQSAFENITATNVLAQQQVATPSAGVFFFGTVKQECSGEDGSKGILVGLDGFEEVLFVPLDGLLAKPKVGNHLLIVGVNQNGHTVTYGEDPLRQTSAPVIVSRTMVPLEE